MTITEQLAEREQDDVAAHRRIVKIAPSTSRSQPEEPTPAPGPRRFPALQYLRQILDTICEAGQPASTPQASLVWPNGAVTWTPSAMDTLHRSAFSDEGPH